jgi:hypothetical protein
LQVAVVVERAPTQEDSAVEELGLVGAMAEAEDFLEYLVQILILKVTQF